MSGEQNLHAARPDGTDLGAHATAPIGQPDRSDTAGTELLATMPFAVGLGITVERVTAEQVIAHLPWQPAHCTAAGILHGGALMALADSTAAMCAFLGLPAGAGTATTNSTTNLFRAVRDSQVTAASVPVHRGRSVVVVRTDLTDDRGRLVAQTIQNQAVTSRPTDHAGGS